MPILPCALKKRRQHLSPANVRTLSLRDQLALLAIQSSDACMPSTLSSPLLLFKHLHLLLLGQ